MISGMKIEPANLKMELSDNKVKITFALIFDGLRDSEISLLSIQLLLWESKDVCVQCAYLPK